MTWRPGAIAAARAVNAIFFVVVAAYCFLTYSPFAYNQFIKPSVLPALTDFVTVSPWLFWVMLLVTVLTLMPHLSGGPERAAPQHSRGPSRPALSQSSWHGPSRPARSQSSWRGPFRLRLSRSSWRGPFRFGLSRSSWRGPFRFGLSRSSWRGPFRPAEVAAWSYVLISALVGIIVLVRPPLARIGSTPAAAMVGVLACLWPVWLAIVDYRLWPAPAVRTADLGRLLAASALAALLAWGTYAVAAPFRVAQTVGIDPVPTLAAGAAASLVADFYVFMGVFLAIAAAISIVRLAGATAAAEFRAIVLLGGVLIALIMYTLVCASITFTGWRAWICSLAIASALTAAWADLARLRSQNLDEPTSVDLYTAPVVGTGAIVPAALIAVILPAVAYALILAVRQTDWNFLLQKVSVLVVWTAVFAVAHALVGKRLRAYARAVLAGVPLAALILFHASRATIAAGAVESYAVVDPSFHLIRDAQLAHSSETAEYYGFLGDHTLLAASRAHPPKRHLPERIAPAPRKPNIFLIVVDSLRRDYLSPYNPRVDFTPAIDALARDSFVYQRAFSRYAGTGLSVPSIWMGGMVPHTVEVPAFMRRNPLVRLLEVNGYRRLLTVDNIVADLVPHDGWFEELDRGKRIMDFDLCATLQETEALVAASGGNPVFLYTLPQNVHLAVASRRRVPAGETYPAGFYDRIASAVHRIDGCVGTFVDNLKRLGTFDDSIVIITADHGDSLGEDERWGHAYYIFPEVMRVPLIVHVPSWLRSGVRTDLDAVAFTSDIVPSLYALLGPAPDDLGPLFGRSLFTAPEADSSSRRRSRYLLASSYGAVYGIVRQNGRELYVVDPVDGADFAFDLTGSSRRLAITASMAAANRRLIAGQLDELSAVYDMKARQ